MKVLFVASHPWLAIGYSKVASFLANYMASYEDLELVHFALETPDHNISGREIHKNIKMLDVVAIGIDTLKSVIEDESPDVVFFYQDAVTMCQYINAIKDVPKTFKVLLYLDIVYEFENHSFVKCIDNYVDHIIVFSECWKKNLARMNISHNKLHVLDHPLATDKIIPVDVEEARKTLNIENTDFVVLNLNRNSYRKCWDLTFKAFLIFLKKYDMDPTLKLFVGAINTYGAGWDFLDLIKTICCELDVDYDSVVQNHIITAQNPCEMTDEQVNNLYNACDIGINTTCGEGFGLCNMEHGSLGKPQIVTNYGGLSDIFEDDYAIKVEPKAMVRTSLLLTAHTGYMAFCDAKDFAQGIEKFYTNKDFYDRCSEQSRYVICEKYDPIKIKDDFRDILITCGVLEPDSEINELCCRIF